MIKRLLDSSILFMYWYACLMLHWVHIHHECLCVFSGDNLVEPGPDKEHGGILPGVVSCGGLCWHRCSNVP